MKAIYTRTIGVYDEKLGEAMEISKGLAEVRKKYYPDHEVYFSFQIGGNPRTVRETLIGEQFTDKALGWYNSDEHQKIVVQRRKATDPKSTIVICEESDSY